MTPLDNLKIIKNHYIYHFQ